MPGGSNGIAVLPELLRTLEFTQALVAFNAAGCQTGNALRIRAACRDFTPAHRHHAGPVGGSASITLGTGHTAVAAT